MTIKSSDMQFEDFEIKDNQLLISLSVSLKKITSPAKIINQVDCQSQAVACSDSGKNNYIRHWLSKADDFLFSYEKMNEENRLASAAFHLHQVAEACYKAVLLVFGNDTPREHSLENLGKLAEEHLIDFKNIFPQATAKNRARFKKLEHAYIGGRYDPEYEISKMDLSVLEKSVRKLLYTTNKHIPK